MAKRKSSHLDELVRGIIEDFDIPTRKDIDTLIKKLDNVEKLLKKSGTSMGRAGATSTRAVRGEKLPPMKANTASSIVLSVIKNSRNGADFAKIQEKTHFDDKKLRNIIFRLNKIGRIKRKKRGIYVVH